MRAARLGALALAFAFAGAAVLAWQREAERPRPLTAAGTLEARDAQVGSLVGGRVRTVHVEEGAQVAVGQPLVTLEADLLDLQVREQRGAVAAAQARLALARSGPRAEERARARVEWQHSENERQRQAALLADGVVGRQAYEAAATAAATSRERLRELEAGSRPEDVAAAAAELERQEGRLALLLRQREETVVRASVAGLVQSLDLRPGDLLAAGQPVATLLEPGQLWARVYVPETRLGLVRVGQEVALAVDSHPGRAFRGRVSEVAQRAEFTPRNVQTLEQRAEQSFGVRVTVGAAPELKPGMAITATFPAEARP